MQINHANKKIKKLYSMLSSFDSAKDEAYNYTPMHVNSRRILVSGCLSSDLWRTSFLEEKRDGENKDEWQFIEVGEYSHYPGTWICIWFLQISCWIA